MAAIHDASSLYLEIPEFECGPLDEAGYGGQRIDLVPLEEAGSGGRKIEAGSVVMEAKGLGSRFRIHLSQAESAKGSKKKSRTVDEVALTVDKNRHRFDKVQVKQGEADGLAPSNNGSGGVVVSRKAGKKDTEERGMTRVENGSDFSHLEGNGEENEKTEGGRRNRQSAKSKREKVSLKPKPEDAVVSDVEFRVDATPAARESTQEKRKESKRIDSAERAGDRDLMYGEDDIILPPGKRKLNSDSDVQGMDMGVSVGRKKMKKMKKMEEGRGAKVKKGGEGEPFGDLDDSRGEAKHRGVGDECEDGDVMLTEKVRSRNAKGLKKNERMETANCQNQRKGKSDEHGNSREGTSVLQKRRKEERDLENIKLIEKRTENGDTGNLRMGEPEKVGVAETRKGGKCKDEEKRKVVVSGRRKTERIGRTTVTDGEVDRIECSDGSTLAGKKARDRKDRELSTMATHDEDDHDVDKKYGNQGGKTDTVGEATSDARRVKGKAATRNEKRRLQRQDTLKETGKERIDNDRTAETNGGADADNPIPDHLQNEVMGTTTTGASDDSHRLSGTGMLSMVAGARPSILEKMRARLIGGQFRMLNEKLYTSRGDEAGSIFKKDPSLFRHYHAGYQGQMAHWPKLPVDAMVDWLRARGPSLKVADFGCGEAKLAKSLPGNTVFSLDLVAADPTVIACDMAKTPLKTGSIDVAVFCLSLMGVNYGDYLREGHRVLKNRGWLLIAEVKSRLDPDHGGADPKDFISALKRLGFKLIAMKDSNKMFLWFEFQKIENPSGVNIKWPRLKACVYKKR